MTDVGAGAGGGSGGGGSKAAAAHWSGSDDFEGGEGDDAEGQRA